jgi:hypothetical protein
MVSLFGSAAAADFGFQLRWSKFTPDGPPNSPRAFSGFPSAVVTTEYVSPGALHLPGARFVSDVVGQKSLCAA